MTKGKQTLLRLVFNSKEHTFDKKILSKYDWVDCFVCEDRAKVRLNDKEGYINTEGKAICPIMYDETDIFSEGLASVCIDGKWGFINVEGEEVCPFQFDKIERWTSEFEGDSYVAYVGDVSYELDMNGTFVAHS